MAGHVASAGQSRRRLLRAASSASVAVAVLLIALKIWAWRQTSSIALLSSLADSTLDLFASLITLVALRVALTPADHEHRFGHGKSEAVAGVVQAVIITGSAGFVAYRAIARLLEPGPIETPAVGYLVMSISIVLTLALVSFQAFVVRQTGSLAIRADSVHYRADLLTNFAVIAALFLSSRVGWLYADPILGLVVVLFILFSVRAVLRDALRDLLDHELPDADRETISRIALAHPDVIGVHDIRTRTAGSAQFIQLHIELDETMTLGRAHRISDDVDATIRRQFPAAEVLIHADPPNEEQSPGAAEVN